MFCIRFAAIQEYGMLTELKYNIFLWKIHKYSSVTQYLTIFEHVKRLWACCFKDWWNEIWIINISVCYGNFPCYDALINSNRYKSECISNFEIFFFFILICTTNEIQNSLYFAKDGKEYFNFYSNIRTGYAYQKVRLVRQLFIINNVRIYFLFYTWER